MSPPGASLFDLLSADLSSYRREGASAGGERFVPSKGGPSIEVTQREERRFMGRTTIARFHTTHAGATAPGALELRHTGRRRRIGIEAVVISGGHGMVAVADSIASDEDLVAAALPLDFTRFELRSDGTEWRSAVELMGATMVAIALPPMRSYVHLYPDQLEALSATLGQLARVLAMTAAG